MKVIYAGIDEAGYGPILGPMVIGRAIFGLEIDDEEAKTFWGAARLATQHAASPTNNEQTDGEQCAIGCDLWAKLSRAVCKKLVGRRGRIPVNDSKKLRTKAAGISHLERGCLAFASLLDQPFSDMGTWLDSLGETTHHQLDLPWYQPTKAWPWDALPLTITTDELGVCRNLLQSAMTPAKVKLLDLGAAVVFEDRFNQMAHATRSKASVNFTFVAQHLQTIWQRYGKFHPLVMVDRQSGRSHYLKLIAACFPQAKLSIIDETPKCSLYHITQGRQQMTIGFQVSGEENNLPVALASMVSKYTRELMMHRFNTWFSQVDHTLKPTAGYAQDGKRFLEEIRPHLAKLHIDELQLVRER